MPLRDRVSCRPNNTNRQLHEEKRIKTLLKISYIILQNTAIFKYVLEYPGRLLPEKMDCHRSWRA